MVSKKLSHFWYKPGKKQKLHQIRCSLKDFRSKKILRIIPEDFEIQERTYFFS